ncbi:MAG: IS200/IS605 family transposase [Muribaculaceae bacterium]|nr:IS200/IS605 family transposase [Muribaculaceae bacterium]
MSKVFLGIHLVFATRCRKRTIRMDQRRTLYAYIHSILQDRKCKTFRINGMQDHVHIAFDLSPVISLSDLARDIKRSTSIFMNPANGFPDFEGWGKGYFAESFSHQERDGVIGYIIDQEAHHNGKAFEQEMEWLSLKAGLRYYPDDWE